MATNLLAPRKLDLQPGWHAISVNYLRGYHYFENDEPYYTYFQEMRPAARAGYSIYIYNVTPGQAVRE